MFDFAALTNEKFIYYFNNNTVFSIEDSEMKDFLCVMSSISESVQFPTSPMEIARAIFEKASLSGNFTENIVSVVHSDKIDALNSVEVFTLLWFSSCRNIFIYTDVNYLISAENGTIGRLLIRLKETEADLYQNGSH